MNSSIALALGAVGYLVASVLYASSVIRRTLEHRREWVGVGRVAGLTGVAFHTMAIGLRCMESHHNPFNTTGGAVTATGWMIVIAYQLLELAQWKRAPFAVGAIAYPLAFLCVFGGVSLERAANQSPVLDSSIIGLHVMAILFAFGLLAIAVCCAILYLIEHHLLKTKRIAGSLFARLPPLTTIDSTAFTLVSFAFPLLSVGILAGIIKAIATHHTHVWGDAHTLASFITWAIYGGYLLAHATGGWRGLKANYLLLAGQAAAILTYLVPSSHHPFA
jgi:HemX protein